MKPPANIGNLIFGPREEFNLRARIINGGAIVAAASTLLAAIINHIINAHPNQIYLGLFAFVLSGFAWLFGRRLHRYTESLFLLVAMQMLMLSGSYSFNYGASGPTSFFYIATIPLYIFALSKWQGAVIATVLYFNLFALYLLEHNGLLTIYPYRNYGNNIPSLLVWLSFSILLVSVTAYYARKMVLMEQDKAIASSKAKTRFLAKMSHEIRTPMNAIIGMNELALDKAVDAQQREWLERAQSSADHLLNLIQDILDISKIEEKTEIVRHEKPFVLRELISRVMRLVQDAAVDKELSLSHHVDEEVPIRVIGDPVHLSQVLVNLLNNAIKYTDKGRVQLAVSFYDGEDVEDNTELALLFEVRDSGVGIKSDDREKIFEIFSQGNDIERIRGEGAGLGLAICRSLVESMGGKIWLQSQPGSGSCFYFTVAFRIQADDVEKSGRQRIVEMCKPDELNLLMADDSEINAEVAKAMLLKAGFTLDIVENGQFALDQLAQKKYDLVLMDLDMPVMDGFEATRKLRSGEVGEMNQHIPILAVTAHALAEFRRQCDEVGMQGFITKPFDSHQLINEIIKAASVYRFQMGEP